ncbi:TPA: hypothetical protein ACMX8F_004958 [Klebsiella pneumoniae]
MTSKLTRDRLQEIAEDGFLKHGESKELARMALAAMESEPVATLDVQSRRPDGNKFALVFSSAAHKLPDDVYFLYRYAQPAPVVPVGLEHLRSIVADPRLLPRRKEWIGGQQYSYVLLEEVEAIVDEACRSAMLQAVPLTNEGDIQAGNSPAQSDCCPAQNVVVPAQSPIDHGYRPECQCSGCKATSRICAELAGNPPVIPDGYVMVPMRLTAENGAKGALSGEFSETKFVNCPECFGDDECETCDGSGRIEITVPVTWTTIKEIWAKGVEHFSATPREVKGE